MGISLIYEDKKNITMYSWLMPTSEQLNDINYLLEADTFNQIELDYYSVLYGFSAINIDPLDGGRLW